MKENNIIIFGEIGGFDGNTLKSIKEQYDNTAEIVKVHINSYGGEVIEGFAIYDYLRRIANEKQLITIVEGAAMSMGSIIAMAGDERLIQDNSEFMVHAPFTISVGTADDFRKEAEIIQTWEDRIINVYVDRGGLDRQTATELVKNETFIDSNRAIELGFMTRKANELKAVANINTIKIDSKMDNDNITKSWLAQQFEKLTGAKESSEAVNNEFETLKASHSTLIEENKTLAETNKALNSKVESFETQNANMLASFESLKAEFEAFKKEPVGNPAAPEKREDDNVTAGGKPEFASMDAFFASEFKSVINN